MLTLNLLSTLKSQASALHPFILQYVSTDPHLLSDPHFLHSSELATPGHQRHGVCAAWHTVYAMNHVMAYDICQEWCLTPEAHGVEGEAVPPQLREEVTHCVPVKAQLTPVPWGKKA